MAWMQDLHSVRAEIAKLTDDPLRERLQRAVADMDAVSTAALLDLLGMAKTTGNARRIAKTMRSLGFISFKSRRLMPGGFRDTVARGWARPLLEQNQPDLPQKPQLPLNEAHY